MDELTSAATAVWHDDPNTAERWFELIAEVVQTSVENAAGADLDWHTVRATLVEAADASGFADAAEQFVTQLESDGEPLQVVALMAERRTELAGAYASALEAAAADSASEDPAVWNEFLATNGPRWDGTEESWPAFREWFLYYAGEQGVGSTARMFCDYAEDGDKLQVFTQYGVVVEAPTVPDDPELAQAVAEVVSEVGTAVLEEFRADEEFADLSDDEVRDLLAEVVREFADGGS